MPAHHRNGWAKQSIISQLLAYNRLLSILSIYASPLLSSLCYIYISLFLLRVLYKHQYIIQYLSFFPISLFLSSFWDHVVSHHHLYYITTLPAWVLHSWSMTFPLPSPTPRAHHILGDGWIHTWSLYNLPLFYLQCLCLPPPLGLLPPATHSWEGYNFVPSCCLPPPALFYHPSTGL